MTNPERAKNNTEYLEKHRFSISSEPSLYMKEMKRFFNEIKGDFPEIKAMSFFGSRIIKNEHGQITETLTHPTLGHSTIKTPPSDLDIIFFYDGQEMDSLEPKKIGVERRTGQIHNRLIAFSKELGKKNIKPKIHTNGVDISSDETEFSIDEFKGMVKENDFELPEDVSFSLNHDNIFYLLASRFLLSTGDIKSIRELVINNFEKDKDGEKYWKVLMEVLSDFERPKEGDKNGTLIKTNLPDYKYPQTLEEARKYFLKT